MTRADALRAALSHAFGRDVGPIRLQSQGGGCINDAAVIDAAGRKVFVKWNDHPLPRQFEAEAAGLRALRAAKSGLVIPEVIAWDDAAPTRAFLALEYLQAGRPAGGFDEALGRGLATLHHTTTDRGFGFDLDGYCGATPQPNGWLPSWIAFYAERRLRPQLDRARKRGLDPSASALLECLLTRLPDWIADDEPPALIHGDLWSGNLHVTREGRPALIDPAAYYAHREAELGMMRLFGGFSPRVFAAYHESFPLREGWQGRIPLYSLYHVLNHYNLFGGSYADRAIQIAHRFVR